MSNYWDEDPLVEAPKKKNYWDEDKPSAQMQQLSKIEPAITPLRARLQNEEREFMERASPANRGGAPGVDAFIRGADNIFPAIGSFGPSVWTAGKQAAASLGFGDPEEARREAAEQARINAPLFGTKAGMVGKMIPELGLAIAGGGGSTFLKQILGNVGTGAGLEAIQPDPQGYDLGAKLKRGALIGGLSDIIGRIGAFATRPFNTHTPGSRENAAITEGEGLPRPLPSTRAGGGFAVPMTQALEQIPVLSHWLNKKLQENGEFFTRYITRGTGTEVSHITDSTRRQMDDRLTQVADVFRATASPADQTVIRDNIQIAQRSIGNDLQAIGAREANTRMNDAINALQPGGGLSATQLLERRSVATKALYRAESEPEKIAYAAIRDAYDGAFLAANPHLAQPFAQWKDQYGKFIEVITAADKGLGRGSTLHPTHVRSSTEFGGKVARTPRERFIQAMDEQTPAPTSAWNRAGNIALLTGTPLISGALESYAKGEPGWGTVGGTALSAALISALSRRPTSQFGADMSRRALAAALMTGGTQVGK